MRFSFVLNGDRMTIDADPNMPLLWALRDHLGLTGAKYSCGIGTCGSCSVLVNKQAIRSCITPLSSIEDQAVDTIEGQFGEPKITSALTKAWKIDAVTQCGFCQPGQLANAVALLKETPSPSEDIIRQSMNGNLCRCGTYPRINKAIKKAAEELQNDQS